VVAPFRMCGLWISHTYLYSTVSLLRRRRGVWACWYVNNRHLGAYLYPPTLYRLTRLQASSPPARHMAASCKQLLFH